MTRTYELGFIVDPRQSDDEVQAICEKFRDLIEAGDATVDHIDNWGRRKLAYPIKKFNEGKYVFFYVSATGKAPWVEVERLMSQSERILRYLVVRTDQDLKRAARKGKVQPHVPGAADNAA